MTNTERILGSKIVQLEFRRLVLVGKQHELMREHKRLSGEIAEVARLLAERRWTLEETKRRERKHAKVKVL